MAVGMASTAADAILDQHLDTDYNFIQLHTGDPGASGTANVAGNATRKAVSWAAASGGSKATNGDTEWTDGEVDTTETYTHVSFWSSGSGGNFGGSGTLTANQVDASGDAFRIPSGLYSVGLGVAT